MSAASRSKNRLRMLNGARNLRERAFQQRHAALCGLREIKSGGGAKMHSAAFVDEVIDRAIEALEVAG